MGYRIEEKDFLGEKLLPDEAYYGVQTLRGKENFLITNMPVSKEPNFVKVHPQQERNCRPLACRRCHPSHPLP